MPSIVGARSGSQSAHAPCRERGRGDGGEQHPYHCGTATAGLFAAWPCPLLLHVSSHPRRYGLISALHGLSPFRNLSTRFVDVVSNAAHHYPPKTRHGVSQQNTQIVARISGASWWRDLGWAFACSDTYQSVAIDIFTTLGSRTSAIVDASCLAFRSAKGHE